MAATKVELFERIQHDSWREGLSVRALARKYGVHRRLVREALARAEPAPRKTPERRSPRLEPFKEIIDGWLRADLDAPRKQRHTVKRIHARLIEEHGAAGVSYSAVRDYVPRRRTEIWIEEGRGPARVFVLLRGRAGRRTRGGRRSGRISGSRRSTVCPASREHTRRAGWKARSAISAATTWSRSRTWTRSRT